MYEAEITIYGEPVPQARAGRRHFMIGNRPSSQAFDPPKSAAFKDLVYNEALAHRPEQPVAGPIRLVVTFYRSIPKSMPKFKQKQAVAEELLPTQKPDLDNLVKGVKDALRGVIWKDDCQVTDSTQRKRYSEVPRTEILIQQIGGE